MISTLLIFLFLFDYAKTTANAPVCMYGRMDKQSRNKLNTKILAGWVYKIFLSEPYARARAPP